jgi:hypothetical protein
MEEVEMEQEPVRRLVKVFQQRRVVDLTTMQSEVQGRSRRSLFRDLAQIDYLASFTHAGRYYTLVELMRFDEHGLWFHGNIGFSRAGTLKETVVKEVEESEVGCMHLELARLLRVRVHNTLLDLVSHQRIARHAWQRCQLYVSRDATRAAQQVCGRKEQTATTLSATSTMAVLVEALRLSRARIDVPTLTARLHTGGEVLTPAQVEAVLVRYGIETGKKTPASRSRRWRR